MVQRFYLMLPRDGPVVFSHSFLLAGGIRFRNLLGSDEGSALSELIVQRVCVCVYTSFLQKESPFFLIHSIKNSR